jgi:hypothetical protein
MINVALPWSQQPQGPVEIEPLWRGSLLSLYLGSVGFVDLVTQGSYVLTNLFDGPGLGGVGAIGNASNRSARVDYPEQAVDGLTVFAVLSGGGSAADDRAFSATDGTATNAYCAIGTAASGSSNKMRVLTVVPGGAGTSTVNTTADVFEGGVHAVALRWVRAVGTTGFVDGALDGFATNTENVAFPVNRSGLCALVRSSVAAQWGGTLYLGAAFNRALSDDELITLTRNPWQLFAPRQIWLPLDSTGTTYTITPSGGVVFSGTATETNRKVIAPSGGVSFAGSGNITFDTGGFTTYTIDPSGGVVFAGSGLGSRRKVIIPSGGVILSGSGNEVNRKVISPTSGVLFGGTGSMTSNTITPGTGNPGERTKVGVGT